MQLYAPLPEKSFLKNYTSSHIKPWSVDYIPNPVLHSKLHIMVYAVSQIFRPTMEKLT